ncbi:nitroreductase [Actinoplanes sp. ATCC 53533]|uniref:Acg family FMN-binding oxidoreductase n=1 Tax=Actinoplanes sp. ATCC 53533 TaxID=1288362 RepID=UPI000F76DEB7|nr:nitroreductase family protein [Actinoplanes sp. ATCC 53533]RSM49315.1 nitroreductase [Actinoplanes sp. ATCC 53533]
MTVTSVSPTRSVLADCVRSATTAPSLHNSQPWLFRIRGSAVEVYADPGRRLQVLDTDGREQLISVGAAVFTLRLALRRAGYASDAALFPRPDDPDLVAVVTATHSAMVTSGVEALAAAIPRRHTSRWPFARTSVPADVLDHLRDAARWESTVLAEAGPAARDAILHLARSADHLLHARPGYRDEIARWTGGGLRHDGVPGWAVGPGDGLERVPIRNFAELSPLPRPSEKFEPNPTILVLATAGDRRCDWVRAGQALQRVLLAATWKGLAATPISQPVEVPAMRRLLIDPRAGLTVQMVLRIGYGTQAGRTPRRPLSDVLLPLPHASRGRAVM